MQDITLLKDGFVLSTDRSKIDVAAVHHFLSTKAYWSLNIPKETVAKSIDQSLCFGVYYVNRQIGFARVITDYATIAYLGDVYVEEDFRGRGLSKWLIETIMNHPNLQGLRRWILLTGDAHGLYQQYGWKEIAQPEKWMECHNKEVYTKGQEQQ